MMFLLETLDNMLNNSYNVFNDTCNILLPEYQVI